MAKGTKKAIANKEMVGAKESVKAGPKGNKAPKKGGK
jgi:hypothetical protein